MQILLTVLIWFAMITPAWGWQTFEATAYSHTGNPTFTGVMPQPRHTIAVDPKVIPLGSYVLIKGKGIYKAKDTGGLIQGKIIDIFMDTEEKCWKWGRREVEIIIFKPDDVLEI